jgi:hypothetical protein
VKVNKRFEDSKSIQMLSTWTHQELCKPIWNQRKKSKVENTRWKENEKES